MRSSRHGWTLETLPARQWKWRMRGSAMWFADRLAKTPAGRFDLIFTCDMTAVADLRALLPEPLRALPIICYFHENQLTYPLSPDDWRDYQYGITNITSALAADAVWFNSHGHRQAFLEAASDLLRRMPGFVPTSVMAAIEEKSTVWAPPVNLTKGLARAQNQGSARPAGPLRILWSHRWEYDKNPEAFFNAMLRLADTGRRFELVLVGEQFRTIPDAFSGSFERLQPWIAHAGYLESAADYHAMIGGCDLVVSTAIQENFGLAVVEAMLAGCMPLFPNRLSYPELLPADLHAIHLYETDEILFRRLAAWCDAPPDWRASSKSLVEHLQPLFGAASHVPRLDDALAGAVTTQARHLP